MTELKLAKAIRALERVEKYLAKQKINKVPANTELMSTYQFVIKTLREVNTSKDKGL